jgi:hypothetical protein
MSEAVVIDETQIVWLPIEEVAPRALVLLRAESNPMRFQRKVFFGYRLNYLSPDAIGIYFEQAAPRGMKLTPSHFAVVPGM